MYEEYYKKFLKNFNVLSTRYDKYKVFLDFLKLASFSIYNVFKKSQDIEKQYLNIIAMYSKEEIKLFTEMFGDLIMMYESKSDITDILGEFFSVEHLGNEKLGQFFTPFHISHCMASISLGEKNEIRKIIDEKGYISLGEPTCGAGGMILGVAKVLMELGINYQKYLLAYAVDISELCVYMTYIQLSLYGIPAIVYCGDSISMKMNFCLETPLYFLNSRKYEENIQEKQSCKEKLTKFNEVIVKGNVQISLW